MSDQLTLDVGPGRDELWINPVDRFGRSLPPLPAHVVGWSEAFKWASVMIGIADELGPDATVEDVWRAAVETPLLYWSLIGNRDAIQAVLGGTE